MVTTITRWIAVLKHIKLRPEVAQALAQLEVLRLQLLRLRLRIAAGSLKCRLLGLDEGKVLTEDRRRAVLVDKFFKMFNESHKSSR